MDEFKKVDSLFSGLDKFVVNSKSLIDHPFGAEGVFVEGQILKTLDDGVEIELCLWTDDECDMSFWDVSIDKKIFDEKEKGSIMDYLLKKGMYLENVQDKFGKWHYGGVVEMQDTYRIQYYEED